MTSKILADLHKERAIIMAKLANIETQIEVAKKAEEELRKQNNVIETRIAERATLIWTRTTYPYVPDNIAARITQYDGEIAVEIDLSSQYHSPDIKFSDMLALSKYFGGTERIGESNDWASPGCDTCDYGSSYGYTIRILPKEKGGVIEIPELGVVLGK